MPAEAFQPHLMNGSGTSLIRCTGCDDGGSFHEIQVARCHRYGIFRLLHFARINEVLQHFQDAIDFLPELRK